MYMRTLSETRVNNCEGRISCSYCHCFQIASVLIVLQRLFGLKQSDFYSWFVNNYDPYSNCLLRLCLIYGSKKTSL